MNKNFLIISREWHNGLHCPTRDGVPGGVFRSRFITLKSPLFLFDIFCTHLFLFLFVFVIEFFFDLCYFSDNVLFLFVFLIVLQISTLPFRT